MQDVPLEEFDVLEDGDMLFVDSTHICQIGSDVNRIIFMCCRGSSRSSHSLSRYLLAVELPAPLVEGDEALLERAIPAARISDVQRFVRSASCQLVLLTEQKEMMPVPCLSYRAGPGAELLLMDAPAVMVWEARRGRACPCPHSV